MEISLPMTVKTSLVIFDMHDVLCRYDRERRLADLAQLSGQTAAAIDRSIWQSGFETLSDAGQLDAAAYLAGFGARLGYPITLRQWLDNRKLAMTPMPEVLALLAELRVTVAVLTNNHVLVREHLGWLFPELLALCGRQFYVSAQFGAAKPDPAVYRACVAAAGAAPSETLFVDDSAANVQGALAAGLQAYRFTDAPALAATLRDRGVL